MTAATHDLPRQEGRLPRWSRWTREFVAFATLPLAPTQSERLGRLYDIVGTNNLFGEESLFVNLGYWANDPETLDDAMAELARLVGREAALGPDDVVLDAGCGFGDQDLLWAGEFGPREIIGINVSADQIAVSERRVRERGKQGRISYVNASAMDLPRRDGSCSKVIALESAFHFPSRRRFFEEAHRVLAPEGRLVTADLVPRSDGSRARFYSHARRVAASPAIARLPNLVAGEWIDSRGYGRVLEDAGFDSVRVHSIRDQVYPPLVRFASDRVRDREMKAVNPILRASFQRPFSDLWTFWADYVIAVADKA